MDGPILKKFDSPLLEHLKSQKLLQPVDDEDLGVLTRPDGTVIPKEDRERQKTIEVLGHNAKGSVLGTDAILECFSPETHDWGKGVLERIKARS